MVLIKSNTHLNVLQCFFAAQRQNYNKYIDIYPIGSKADNLVVVLYAEVTF